MEKVNLADKFSRFSDYWNPKIVGELNGQEVKLVKLKGEFVWHHHENEDEMFFVIKGQLLMRLRDRDIVLNEGEFFIVPKGIEHQPIAQEEVYVMLFEPKTTLNTGNIQSDRTVKALQHIGGLDSLTQTGNCTC
ncbi:cupin domain-containing protein [Candidatus Gracilibacteria bacterium]|nr:cupin domain-containing protein [Candidatus Gracilibacteria bacterium]